MPWRRWAKFPRADDSGLGPRDVAVPLIYLLRHGMTTGDEADPPLSEAGALRMEREARGMASLGLRFDAIVSSPLIRAAQTARIVSRAVSHEGVMAAEEALGSGCTLPRLAQVLARHAAARSVLVVGHQPDMGRLAAALVGSSSPVPFQKGTLCCVEVPRWPAPRDDPKGALTFLLPPEILEALSP